ncbi:MAG TPA: DUF4157 domain-containing protein [Geothrix sp.]|nr:DUF4157 domain-containing protein [Geothrix sp.]
MRHDAARPLPKQASGRPLLPPRLQRKCACETHGAEGGTCAACARQGRLSRKGPAGASHTAQDGVPPLVHDVLRTPGQSLPRDTRAFMEPRFGQDFSRVRVHADARAAESARAVEAQAYTVGSHVVFGTGAFRPESAAGQHLLAHELAHVAQQGAVEPSGSLRIGAAGDAQERDADAQADRALGSGAAAHLGPTRGPLLQRKAATPGAPETNFDDCNPTLQADLKAKHPTALANVDRAIRSLTPTWANMDPTDKGAFRQFFDPANSGDIDDGFVRDVRGNFQRIRGEMASLRFDCNQDSGTLCGDGHKWCTGGRLMWTCFGNLHVCPAYATETDEAFKTETMIHESTHNALHTTDREYASSASFSRLRPRGSGILSFLSNLPVLGMLFRLIRSNNDSLYNPDSYASYAMRAGRAAP